MVLRVGEPIPVAAIAENAIDQLLAGQVVPSLVGEQQPMRGIVIEGR